MTISFNTVPSNTLVPLFYAEMNNSAANTAVTSAPALLIGHASNDAAIEVNSLVLMPSADYARQICGAGASWRVWWKSTVRQILSVNCMLLQYRKPEGRRRRSG